MGRIGVGQIGLLVCMLALAAGGARAQDTAARSLAATCAGCHGTNGRSAGGMPELAGMDRSQMITLLQEFRSGKRTATVMHQISKGFTDEQLERIAGYFAAQAK